MGAGRLCQLCLQIDSRGRDLGRVQRSSGVGDGEQLYICCVSSSKRRNPVAFQSKKGFMDAFLLLEIQPWPIALRIAVSTTGFVCRWGNQKGWRQ